MYLKARDVLCSAPFSDHAVSIVCISSQSQCDFECACQFGYRCERGIFHTCFDLCDTCRYAQLHMTSVMLKKNAHTCKYTHIAGIPNLARLCNSLQLACCSSASFDVACTQFVYMHEPAHIPMQYLHHCKRRYYLILPDKLSAYALLTPASTYPSHDEAIVSRLTYTQTQAIPHKFLAIP
jgi:hypothetical protein